MVIFHSYVSLPKGIYIHTYHIFSRYSPDIFHRIWLEVKIWDLDALALHCSVPTGEETATWHLNRS
jgi:hypothetical protein